MAQKPRYVPAPGIWSYAATDPRLSDAELRVFLVCISLANVGMPGHVTAIARLLVRSEAEVRKAVHRLVECRYLVDRSESPAIAAVEAALAGSEAG